jgi:hypothetical protein
MVMVAVAAAAAVVEDSAADEVRTVAEVRM